MTPFDHADAVPSIARAARGGLCAACAHARAIASARGSVFLRCDHPDLPRYPAVPVIACDGFALRAPAAAQDEVG
ncbi:MAG: hypothetical protein ABR510_00250 [Trueperaceae bacterium]